MFLIVLHHTVPRSRYKNSNLMWRTRYRPILSLNSPLALSFLICHLINFLPCQNPLASHSLLHGCQEAERNTDSITERRSYASVNTWTRQTRRNQHTVSTNSRRREESGEGTQCHTSELGFSRRTLTLFPHLHRLGITGTRCAPRWLEGVAMSILMPRENESSRPASYTQLSALFHDT